MGRGRWVDSPCLGSNPDPWADPKRRSPLGRCNLRHRRILIQNLGLTFWRGSHRVSGRGRCWFIGGLPSYAQGLPLKGPQSQCRYCGWYRSSHGTDVDIFEICRSTSGYEAPLDFALEGADLEGCALWPVGTLFCTPARARKLEECMFGAEGAPASGEVPICFCSLLFYAFCLGCLLVFVLARSPDMKFLLLKSKAAPCSALPQTSMEPDKGPFKEGSSLQSIPRLNPKAKPLGFKQPKVGHICILSAPK